MSSQVSSRRKREQVIGPGAGRETAHGTRRRRPHRVLALTLIEMIMVVTIVGILSTVVIGRIGPGTLGRPGVAAIARQLAVDLRYTRSLAIMRGTNHLVKFDSTGFRVFRKASPSDVPVENRRKLPRGIGGTITAWNFEFNPTGAALIAYQCDLYASGVTYRVNVIIATGTVTVTKL